MAAQLKSGRAAGRSRPPTWLGSGRRLRLAGTFLKIGALNELQYRVNFFLSLVQSVAGPATSCW
jgi:hypothetical protein